MAEPHWCLCMHRFERVCVGVCMYVYGRECACVWKPELLQESRQVWTETGHQQWCERCQPGRGRCEFTRPLREP